MTKGKKTTKKNGGNKRPLVKTIDQMTMARLIAQKCELTSAHVMSIVLEEQKLTMQFVNEGYKVIKKNYLTLEKRSYAGKQWVSPLDHKTYDMGDRKRVIVRVGDGFKNYINDEHKDGDRLCRFMAGSKAIPSEQLAAETT